jgi:predicted PurR-regulated permease PerM
VLFFSLIGGVSAFGPMGLVMGPLAVVFLDSMIRLRPSQRATQA